MTLSHRCMVAHNQIPPALRVVFDFKKWLDRAQTEDYVMCGIAFR
jgi:hypothetical protein